MDAVYEYGNIWNSAADGVHCIGADGELPGEYSCHTGCPT